VRPAWRSLELVVNRKKGQAESGPVKRQPNGKEVIKLKRRPSFKEGQVFKEAHLKRRPS
jgi:hypothetical protein